MLIVINLQEGSGSYEITVKRIDFADSRAIVTLERKSPHIIPDRYAFTVEHAVHSGFFGLPHIVSNDDMAILSPKVNFS